MQIGAAIEALGPHIIYNAASDIANLNKEDPSTAMVRRRCAQILTAFAQNLQNEKKQKKSKTNNPTSKKSPVQSSSSLVYGVLVF